MAREFEGKLSKADVKYLQERYPSGYVDRMVELHGLSKGGEKELEAPEKPEEPTQQPEPEEPGEENEGPEDDILGSELFNPGEHTADQVLEYLKDASDEEKERVRAVEADGKGRKTIVEG